MNEMQYLKRVLFFGAIICFIAWLAGTGHAQTVPEPTPTPPAAVQSVPTVDELLTKVLTLQDKIAAMQKIIEAQDKARAEDKKNIMELRIELAKNIGILTGCQQGEVRSNAIIDLLLKKVQPKVNGIKLF